MSTMNDLDEPYWGAGGMGFSPAELRARSDGGGIPPRSSAPAGPVGITSAEGDANLLWGCGGLGLPRPR